MNRDLILYAAGACLSLFGFTSCGEDRTNEFKELTKECTWIYDTMKEYYFWYEEMPDVKRENYFKEPETFFKSLLSQKDKYSYLETADGQTTRSINRNSTYGFDFALYVDPATQSTSDPRRYARILYVLPNSPASEAGLKRGDWISTVGGVELTSQNYTALIFGTDTRLTLATPNLDEATGQFYWDAEEKSVQLSASRWVEDNPFYVDTVFHFDNHRVAYLMYNSFSTGPENTGKETDYSDRMHQIFQQFKAQEPTDFILDLRYNPGGYLTCAQELASLLVPQEATGKIFCTTVFNDKKQNLNESYLFEKQLMRNHNLNLSRIFIITSSLTASASESIINGLRPFMGENNVELIGARTEGKNVASLTFNSDFGFSLHPIVAQVYNSKQESDYADGFAPTFEFDEFNYITPFYPLGDIRESTLAMVIYRIITGSYPSEFEESQQATRLGRSSYTLPTPSFHSISLKHYPFLSFEE